MSEIPKKMRGMLLTGHGGLDQLVLRDDLPVPVPGPRDVLIRVGAAGVNNTDLNTRIGWYSKSNKDVHDASWSGQVDPLVAQEFPLEQLPKAQELFGMKQHIGKFVVNLQL